MSNRGLVSRLLPLAFLVLFAQTGFGQEQDLNAYPVPLVEVPTLERPTIEIQKDLMQIRTTGRFPEWDGEFFYLNLVDEKQMITSEDSVRKVLDMFLEVINWRQGADALQEIKPVVRPEAGEGKLEAMIKDLTSESREKVRGEFGEVNQAAEDAIQEQAELARKMGRAKAIIHQFNQYYRKIPIDNTYLRLVWDEREGITSLRGRLFNEIQMANRQGLSADQAVGRAREYISKHTELGDDKPVPELVILPYGKAFRYAWKLQVVAVEGAYEVWIDAGSGEVLQLAPMFASDDATGLIFWIDPNGTTEEKAFDVDAPSGGQYRLVFTGKLEVTNSGGDGVCSGDLTIADAGTGDANFNVAPHNGTTVLRTNQSGYNCRFQDINAYAILYNHIDMFNDLFGSATLPDISVEVNHSNPCGFGIDNACANWSTSTLKFGIGNATIGSSTSCNDLFNSALDATVLTHEFGHLVNATNNTGTIPLHIHEGLSDFWAYTMCDTNTFGAFWGQNCATHDQGGYLPRRVEGLDVFPEHRALSTSGYGDGQIVGWALWNVRREFTEMSALGPFLINSNLLDALSTASFVNTSTDKQVHDNFLNLEEELVTLFSTSTNVHKVLSGFARAGFFLAPVDAVIDIDDDYLDRGAAGGPTFTVWTGRDYTFSGSSASTTSPPFNTRFEVEVANDAAFTSNLVSSGVLSGVTASDGGKATWTLPTADWNTVKAGNHLYYRVTTTDDTGGTIRTSGNPGNGFLTGVPVAYAVINESGECECSCGAAANASGSSAAVTLIPMIFGFAWMLRLARRKKR